MVLKPGQGQSRIESIRLTEMDPNILFLCFLKWAKGEGEIEGGRKGEIEGG